MRKDRLHFRKLNYYTRNVTLRVMPRALFVARLPRLLDSLADYSREEILSRVDYCNKLLEPFSVDRNAPPCRLKDVQSAYYFDFQRRLRYFPASVRYYFRFSDSTRIPERPTFLKARSISDANSDSVMLN
ncbi:MAG: lipopolysaccharide A protein, partial [Chthoniobacterales bacterium]